MSNTTLAPTTKAKVNSNAYFSFTCYVDLAETERIIVELTEKKYDYNLNTYVNSGEKVKYQLEQLTYTEENNQVRFYGGTIRGFRKDGALKFRANYVPTYCVKEVLAQIPDHYHDYARQAFDKEMEKLVKRVTTTQQNGVKL